MEKDYKSLHRGLVLKYFWQVIRKYKTVFYLTIVCYTIPYVVDIFVPIIYLRLWAIIGSSAHVDIVRAQHVVLFVLVLLSVRFVFRRGADYLDDYFTSSVMGGLRKQGFNYLIKHSNEFFANNFSGSLVQKINKYARAFEKLKQKIFSDGFAIFIRGIGTIISLYVILPHKYSFIILIFFLFFIITGNILTKYKLKYDIDAALKDSVVIGAFADSIGNNSSVQLFTGHDYEEKSVAKTINEQTYATRINWYLWDSIFGIQSMYVIAVEIIIFWVAIEDWQLGLIGLPIFILLQSYLTSLVGSLWSWSGIVRAYYESFADAQEMALILDMPYGVQDNATNNLSRVTGNISFDTVTYVYNKNNTKVLDKFSLEVPAGQKLALVGPSGSGKTTFVRLIMRLFDVTSGVIRIDGVDIASITQENLREHIGFVPQDPVLFHRTLMENIRYGKRDATDVEVKRAATLAHCDDFIDKLPLGYDTFVGERGVKLSGGERQRVAIARAILKDAPILILDEATSALDSHSEMLIQDALHTLIAGKTTIVIAHRLSTIREMDRIIVISEGKVVEDGVHDELINTEGGIYKKLWDIQAGGFKVGI
jgi:ATP-binding cassette subfamily B protein